MSANIKKIALERIATLFHLAREAANDRPELADRYVEIARKIAMRSRVRIPKEYRIFFCKRCKRFLVPGVGSRIRIQPRREPHVVITCKHCDAKRRVPLRRSYNRRS
ncbi:MAG: ribonuclease P protein component 4 [Nitrososphaerota archaeon]|nr:ribonuclease P [Candidatus Bathyarchaeota archaeon]MDW8048819.1 ribonuclease P protein component 4 [Nitrososphaerota archaeon]